MFKKQTAMLKLQGEIDTASKPAEIRITPTSGNVWEDFGYWLEAVNFMAYQAMLSQGWDKQQILDYIHDYLAESLEDVSLKK